jgi:hypothetical protein
MRSYAEIAGDTRPGRAFSNGSQWEYWADRWCYRCANDDIGLGGDEKYCPILSASLALDGTPREWQAETEDDHVHGDYTCTEFEERRDDDGDDPEPEPEPPPVIDGQIDVFEVFADQIVESLPQPVGAES